jgi:hypothetical protein
MKTMAALPMDSSNELTHLWVDFDGHVASVSEDDYEYSPQEIASFVVVFVPSKYPVGLSDGWGFCYRDQPEFRRAWTILFRDSDSLSVRGPLSPVGIWMEREKREIHVRFSILADTSTSRESYKNLAISVTGNLVTACDLARAWQSWLGRVALVYQEQTATIDSLQDALGAHPFRSDIRTAIGEFLREDISSHLPNRKLPELLSVYADLLEDARERTCEDLRCLVHQWLKSFGDEFEPKT